MQTAEAALDEVNRALVQARQVTVHAGNGGTNDPSMLAADQEEIRNILEQIDRIASSTQYGHNNLLDGSRSGNGVATGRQIIQVSGTTLTGVPVEDYIIKIDGYTPTDPAVEHIILETELISGAPGTQIVAKITTNRSMDYTDGTNRYQSSADVAGFPHLITITLDAPQEIAGLTVISETSLDTGLRNFDISVLDTDGNWTDVRNCLPTWTHWAKEQGFERAIFPFTPVTTQEIRLKINTANMGWNGYEIHEISLQYP